MPQRARSVVPRARRRFGVPPAALLLCIAATAALLTRVLSQGDDIGAGPTVDAGVATAPQPPSQEQLVQQPSPPLPSPAPQVDSSGDSPAGGAPASRQLLQQPGGDPLGWAGSSSSSSSTSSDVAAVAARAGGGGAAPAGASAQAAANWNVRVGRSGGGGVQRVGAFWSAQRINARVAPARSLGAGAPTAQPGAPPPPWWDAPRPPCTVPECLTAQAAAATSHATAGDPFWAAHAALAPGLALQPYVTGVTSYSPNVRRANSQYRNAAPVAFLYCAPPALPGRCPTPAVVTSAPHSFRPGDAVYFDTVLGADRSVLLGAGGAPQKWVVAAGAVTATSFTLKGMDTTAALSLDVSSATVVKAPLATAANPSPAYGPHDWSYEPGDTIYFFVSFSEPIIVSGGVPSLLLNTGSHYEAGAADAAATFIGGGVGEKKRFWKNNAGNPAPQQAGGQPAWWSADTYSVDDGGCVLANFHRLSAAQSACARYGGAGCSCAAYSGVTLTANATIFLRGVHTLNPGDLVVVAGVTGASAAQLNGQWAVGAVGSSGVDGGNNWLTLAPPLDLTGAALDARFAVVGRVTRGDSCRAGADASGASGAAYCVFSSPPDGGPWVPTDSQALRYVNQGAGARGPSADGPVLPERQRYVFDEARSEQYMDNVLAFRYDVPPAPSAPFTAVDTYDQSASGLSSSADSPQLSSALDAFGTGALTLPAGATVRRACPLLYQVTGLSCGAGGTATVTVLGKHELQPGDAVQLAGIAGATTAVGEFFALNRLTTVTYVTAGDGTSVNRPDWQVAWSAEPAYAGSLSSFSQQQGPAARRCEPADAALALPMSGDTLRGTTGVPGSLSWNKAIVVGRPYVTNVSSPAADGIYGFNQGYGIIAGGTGAALMPDMIDIKVSFSEPVVASCGSGNDMWSTPAQYLSLRFSVCTSISLVLTTFDSGLTCASTVCVNSTLTGTPGSSVFPTSFLTPVQGDPPNVLNFRYVVRRGDLTARLQYANQFALQVSCARNSAVNGTCVSMSSIRRLADNKLSALRLPPTARDVGACTMGRSPSGQVLCPYTSANHAYSLAGLKRLQVQANF